MAAQASRVRRKITQPTLGNPRSRRSHYGSLYSSIDLAGCGVLESAGNGIRLCVLATDSTSRNLRSLATRRSFLLLPALALAALCCAAILLLSRGSAADAAEVDWVPHATIVSDTPERGYPIIRYEDEVDNRNRRPQSYAMDLVGNYIISGGNFLEIELQDGSIIDQPYLSIVDWRTKEQVCTNLDVDDEVLSIVAGPDANTAFISGRFDKVTGADGVERTRNKVALINMRDCEVDRTFVSTGANGKISDITIVGDRLFVGGDFTSIGGVNQTFVAELDPTTGATRTAFNPQFTSAGLSSPIRGIGTNPQGTRLLLGGRFGSVADSFGNNLSNTVTAIFDISGASPVLTGHSFNYPHPEFGNRLWATSLQDVDISPDGTNIGLAFGTATISDFVYLVPAVETPTNATWQHYMRDSNFAVSLSNNAMYVAGHFCKIDSGPGATVTSAPNSGPSECTGSSDFPGGAWRTQLAALSLTDGTPLDWNPGNDAFRGGAALNVVSRGLLAGFDGDRTNNIRTGTTAFFDFGAPDDPRVDQTCQATVDGQDVNLVWDAVDGVDEYIVRRDGQFAADAGNTTAFTDNPGPGTYSYQIRTRLDGIDFDADCTPATVTVEQPGLGQTCTATDNGDGSVTVSWDEIVGENTYIVRRNGSFIANVGPALTYTESPGEGIYTYVIRSRMGGVTTNTTCEPTVTIDAPPPVDQTCQAVEDGNGTVTLTWDEIPGEDSYQVRRNGSWVASPGDVLTYDDIPGPGTFTYVIRSRMGGVTVNTTCQPEAIRVDSPPPVDQTCTLTIVNGEAVLDWTAIDGETTYIVRRNDTFLANVGPDLTFTDPDYLVGNTYLIRSRMGNVTTDTNCV